MDESGEMHSTEAHADNVIIGHKVRMGNTCEGDWERRVCSPRVVQATLSNPNVSEEAKERSAQILEEMDRA